MRQREMKHQDFNLERGFSLMEVLIAMAVSTIVMFAIYTTFHNLGHHVVRDYDL